MTALVLPPADGAPDAVLPGGCGLLEDCLFHLDSLGVGRAMVPCTPRSTPPMVFPRGMRVDSGPFGRMAADAESAAAGEPFLLVDSSVIRRQDPSPLFRTAAAGAAAVVALSSQATCGGRSLWTLPDGAVLHDDHASGRSNTADSGMWLVRPGLSRLLPLDRPAGIAAIYDALGALGAGLAAEFCPGYTRRPGPGTAYLSACGEILSGMARPWSRALPRTGVLVEPGAILPDSAAVRGFLWARSGSTIGEGVLLENCVLMPGCDVGERCSLRNSLVTEGARVRSGTEAMDKTPKMFGRSGRE